jgi:hypothetical protein
VLKTATARFPSLDFLFSTLRLFGHPVTLNYSRTQGKDVFSRFFSCNWRRYWPGSGSPAPGPVFFAFFGAQWLKTPAVRRSPPVSSALAANIHKELAAIENNQKSQAQ